MYQMKCDVAVIGGGPAGLAAAIAAKEEGAEKVLIVERDQALGGILQQCIHPGFGLTYFHEELTGPEYYERFIKQADAVGVEYLLDTMVLEIDSDADIICVNQTYGVTQITSKSIVLAMGCRERTRSQICTPGSRPAGVYTAGASQRLCNLQNEKVGNKIVVLGSGDIGMIMARRMTLEGAEVVAVVEIMDYLSGLTRNRVQCLDDFNIPLLLSHTVTRIVGNERVTGVYVAEVDANKKPIPETEKFYECDTLLLSVGLIPENELSRETNVKIDPITQGPYVNQFMQTSAPAIFACGNVVHVNDLVDNVTKESQTAGRYAAQYALSKLPEITGEVQIKAGNNVRYICPQKIVLTDEQRKIPLYFRVKNPQMKPIIEVSVNGKVVSSKKKIKANPGEMENVLIDRADLNPGELEISVLVEG